MEMNNKDIQVKKDLVEDIERILTCNNYTAYKESFNE